MTDNLDVTQTLGQERAHAISHISAEDEQRYSPESYQKALNNTPLSVFARAAAAYASAPPLGHLRSPDIVDCVLCDHANVLTLFNRFFQAAEAGALDTMKMVLNALAIDLRLHSQAEEQRTWNDVNPALSIALSSRLICVQVLYPTLFERLGSEGSRIHQRALAEHAIVEQSIAEVLQLQSMDQSHALLHRMKQCQTEFMTHQGEEESAVLPKLTAVCSREELCSLGFAFKSAKQSAALERPPT